MVKITLTNQVKESPYKKAILDISIGICLIDEKEEMDLALLDSTSFQHPLLSHPSLKSETTDYQYSYNDMQGLLNTAKYVYATLLHTKNPKSCRFIINPEPQFFTQKAIYKIPFSLDPNNAANQFISVSQINGIISQSSHHSFHFFDNLLIDTILLYDDLPSMIDGDELFNCDPIAYELLNKPDAFDQCELRNINHFIGFGIYAREDIKKGTAICLYQGRKENPKDKRYHFIPRHDALGLGIDARLYGNIGRFVNHAPPTDGTKSSDPRFLDANLIGERYVVYGIEVIIFTTVKDIRKNEQLLVDYGARYFEGGDEYRFNVHGSLCDPQGKRLQEKHHDKLSILRIMAKNGITQAAYQLLRRPLIAVVIVLAIAVILYSFAE